MMNYVRVMALGFGPKNFALGELATLRTVLAPSAPKPFMPRNLVVASSTSRHFIIRGVSVDEHPQMVTGISVPAACFDTTSIAAPLSMDRGVSFSLEIERVPFDPSTRWERVLQFLRLKKKHVEPELVPFVASLFGEVLATGEPPHAGPEEDPDLAALGKLEVFLDRLHDAKRITDDEHEDAELLLDEIWDALVPDEDDE